jgi:hypothetical protein
VDVPRRAGVAVVTAWRCLMRLRRQNYPGWYLERWLEAIRWLRAQDKWILDREVTVTSLNQKESHERTRR